VNTRIYVLSTGRSGSTFLYTFFKEHFPELEIGHQKKGSRLINIFGNLPTDNPIYFKFLQLLFMMYGRGWAPYSTVDPTLSMSIYKLLANNQVIDEKYKIIHLVRDPRDFVTSFMNWKHSSIKKIILHYVIPFWQPSPKFDKDIPLSQKFSYNKFKQFCYIWNYKNSQFWEAFYGSNRYKLVRLEDITSSKNNIDNITSMLNFLNLTLDTNGLSSSDNSKVNKSNKNRFPEYRDWPPEYKEYLIKTCGNLMMTFGYHY